MADAGGLRRRVTGRRGLWIVATIAVVGAVLAVVGIWYLPDRMYPPGIDGGAEARAALQGGLLTAAAALIAVTGRLIASGADLARKKLGRAKLFEANLTGADLTRATFLRADLTGADLTDATLGGTSLFGMNLRETVGLVQGQVNAARGDARTLLPEGLVQPASWTPGGSGGS